MFMRSWVQTALPATARLLDVGCGTGALLDFMQGRAEALGVDFSPEALSFCQSRGLRRLAQAGIQTLPFADNSFDAVSAMDVLCHRDTGEPADCMTELARVTKPGGWVFLNLPAYQWLLSPHDIAVHNSKRFSRQQTRNLIAGAGLVPVTIACWNTILFPPIVLARMLRGLMRAKESDLTVGNGVMANRIGNAVLATERGVLCATGTLPFGLSIFAVARKPA